MFTDQVTPLGRNVNARLGSALISSGDSFPTGGQKLPELLFERVQPTPPDGMLVYPSNAEMEFRSMVFTDGTRRYPSNDRFPTSDPVLSGGPERERLQRALEQAEPDSEAQKALQAVLNPNADQNERLDGIMKLLSDPNGQPLLDKLVNAGAINQGLLEEIRDVLGGGTPPSGGSPSTLAAPPSAPKPSTPPPVPTTPPAAPTSKGIISVAIPLYSVIQTLGEKMAERVLLSNELNVHKSTVIQVDYDAKSNEVVIPAGRKLYDPDRWVVDSYKSLISLATVAPVRFQDADDRKEVLEALRGSVGRQSASRLLTYALLKYKIPTRDQAGYDKISGVVQKAYESAKTANPTASQWSKIYDRLDTLMKK